MARNGSQLIYIMKYIVYCTKNERNSKIYIGVHKTQTPFKFDGYIGCGVSIGDNLNKASTAFQRAVKKYGYKHFKRTVLGVFDTEEEAYHMEGLLVNTNFVKRHDTYNMVTGGRASGGSNSKSVAMYDQSGNFLQKFKSQIEAANFVGSNPADIGKAAKGVYKTVKGYIWRYYNSDLPNRFVNDIKLPRIKAVVQYSKTGYRKRTWKSALEASKSLNCDRATITSICRGKSGRVTCGGYQWRYETDGLDRVDPV